MSTLNVDTIKDKGGTTGPTLGGNTACTGNFTLTGSLLSPGGGTYAGLSADALVHSGGNTVTLAADNLSPTVGTIDLGSTSNRWNNIYTSDLDLSNEKITGGNDVDGSEGHWTMQEGADDLFLINRNTGKKYKFNLTEVS